MVGVFGHSCFLECHYLLSLFRTSFVSYWKTWPFMAVYAPAYYTLTLFYLRVSYALWFHKNFVLMGYCKWQIWMEQQGIVGACYHMHLLSSSAFSIAHVTSLIKHKFKDKMIKHFKMATPLHWTKSGTLLNAGLYATAQVTGFRWSQPVWRIKILREMLWSVIWNNRFWTFSEPLLCLYASESPKVIQNLAFTILWVRKMGRTSGTWISGGSSYFLLNFLALPICTRGMATDCFVLIKFTKDL